MRRLVLSNNVINFFFHIVSSLRFSSLRSRLFFELALEEGHIKLSFKFQPCSYNGSLNNKNRNCIMVLAFVSSLGFISLRSKPIFELALETLDMKVHPKFQPSSYDTFLGNTDRKLGDIHTYIHSHTLRKFPPHDMNKLRWH